MTNQQRRLIADMRERSSPITHRCPCGETGRWRDSFQQWLCHACWVAAYELRHRMEQAQ